MSAHVPPHAVLSTPHSAAYVQVTTHQEGTRSGCCVYAGRPPTLLPTYSCCCGCTHPRQPSKRLLPALRGPRGTHNTHLPACLPAHSEAHARRLSLHTPQDAHPHPQSHPVHERQTRPVSSVIVHGRALEDALSATTLPFLTARTLPCPTKRGKGRCVRNVGRSYMQT